MFQTFTGNSRRPRQVNLSGRNNNPFAATSSSPQVPTPQNPQNAITHAQQERRARQQERDRLQAAKILQRIWRGHASRRNVRDKFRKEWDFQEEISMKPDSVGTPSYGTVKQALDQLRLLIQFASPADSNDTDRVQRYAMRFCESFQKIPNEPLDGKWRHVLLHMTRICIATVGRTLTDTTNGSTVVKDLVNFLLLLTDRMPNDMARCSQIYFHMLAEIIKHSNDYNLPPLGVDSSLLNAGVLSLLKQPTQNEPLAYEGFITELLTIADLDKHLDLHNLATRLNHRQLAKSLKTLLSQDSSTNVYKINSQDGLLWLMAYFVNICRKRALDGHLDGMSDADYFAIVSSLLSFLAENIQSRFDKSAKSTPNPLPKFIQNEISSLINQESISSLLAHSEFASPSDQRRPNGSDDAAILATYALTLLRVFPRRGDEIRMWLYLGSTSKRSDLRGTNDNRIPAIKYFWEAVTQTRIFRSVSKDPRHAIELLKSDGVSTTANWDNPAVHASNQRQEWRVLLLFLELYTFVLKVMDDEEFINGASETQDTQSWTRRSALKLTQVKDLTTFLKNLAFSTYWNATEILGSKQPLDTHSLANYFGHASVAPSKILDNENITRIDEVIIAGISGLNLNYMKSMVTGLLRMVYERDSRRSFLPKDHWLMTKYFDMEGFIPAVVEEEDYRQHTQDAEDDEEEENIGDGLEEDIDTDERLVGTRRTQQVRRIERLKRQQRKTARRKQLEAVTPRLEILQNMPFFIPFPTRVEVFREFIFLDQTRRRGGNIDPDQWRMSVMHNAPHTVDPDSRRAGYEALSKHHAKIRREHCFEDAYQQFYELGEGLKEPIQITFVDQFDTVEAGIDGGGVTKEFLTSVTSEAFTPGNGQNLFVENDQHLLYPNPSAVDERKDLLRQLGFKEGSPDWNEPIRDLLRQFEFLGRVIGKCLYEGILVDIHFAPFFLVKWALTGGSGSAPNESNYRANINDLRDLDEGLYQGLLQLKNYSGNVEDFSLDFTVTDTVSAPVYDKASSAQPAQRTITRDLRPKGSEISVTNENRLVYISYMARHRLQIQPHLQTNAFLRGLGTMIQPSWLSMFNQSELQTLLGGDSSEIDVADLRRNTLYGGVYVIGDDGQEHPTVQKFWEVMQAFSDSDRRKVLKYVTSTPRAPLLGFNQLNPRFSIRDSSSDQTRLPSTSTCVNLLKLPIYTNEQTLKDKLLYAINAGAGFNLS